VLSAAVSAQRDWGRRSLDDRIALLSRGVDAFVAGSEAIAEELTWQMGRPFKPDPERGCWL